MKKTLLATFIIAMASTAYATTTGRTLSTEPFVVDGYTPDTRSSEAKETYANRVTKSDVEGNNHSVMGQDNTVLAEHGSSSNFGNQNVIGANAKDGNIFGDGYKITITNKNGHYIDIDHKSTEVQSFVSLLSDAWNNPPTMKYSDEFLLSFLQGGTNERV